MGRRGLRGPSPPLSSNQRAIVMTAQADLFASRTVIVGVDEDCAVDGTLALAPPPIAVPCGFSNRHNLPCRRSGNWPVMIDGKQLTCRGRPMIHCDPECFKSDVRGSSRTGADDDILWDWEDDGDG